jgi:large subunit ribosomal protein L22
MASEKTFRAVHKRSPVTPRKARYVVDLIRGKPVNEALDTLRFCARRAAPLLSKVVMSALASAQLDSDVDHSRLHVVDARADDGPTQRRYTPRSRGQMYPLLLRYSHLTVVLGEQEPAVRRKRGAKKSDRSRGARVAASRAAQEKAQSETPAETETPDAPSEGSE